MKLMSSNFQRILCLGVLFAGIAVLIIPDAFAMPGPGTERVPSKPIVDETIIFKIIANNLATHEINKLRAYDTGQTVGIAGIPAQPDCVLAGGDVGVTVWELQRAGSTLKFDVEAGQTFAVKFGKGLAPTFPGNTAVNFDPAAGAFTWTVVDGPNVANNIDDLVQSTDVPLAPYQWAACGIELDDTPFIFSDSFFTQIAVAGELIPIQTSALLLAGFNANAIWILPALVAVAGGAFAVLRFQVQRK